MLRKLISAKVLVAPNQQETRKLWWWTVVMFNRMDVQRTKALGHDRTTAEWLLKNGACARFVNSPVLHCDYNILPPENTKFFVKEIEARNAGLSADGFMHIKGCEKLDRISLTDCSYITDEALYKLEYRKDSLKFLEIVNCKNITDDGLRSLKVLTKLEKLVARDLPYVSKPAEIAKELKEHLKNCEIVIE